MSERHDSDRTGRKAPCPWYALEVGEGRGIEQRWGQAGEARGQGCHPLLAASTWLTGTELGGLLVSSRQGVEAPQCSDLNKVLPSGNHLGPTGPTC